MEHKIITYTRTKQFLNTYIKDESKQAVKLHETVLKRFNVSMAELHQMQQKGLLQRTDEGYKVLIPGLVDFALIRKAGQAETTLHKWMKNILLKVDFPASIPVPLYFETFLKVRKRYLDLFFKADHFCGRIHTPVSSLSRDLRPFIILCGESTVSLDVGQMQPTLLAEVLHDHIGTNAFSDAIFEGKDIYLILQSKAGLQSRDEAKKRFYEITFDKPNNSLKELLEGENWIAWINEYKSKPEPRNPKREKVYNNLAWILQTYEVRIMTKIWQKLAESGIPFLTVHDEIICRRSDAEKVEKMMNCVLSDYFRTFKINIK